MQKGTHGIDEKSFGELDYAGQARTLNTQILGIGKGLKAHIRKGMSESRDISQMKEKYKRQLSKLIKSLD